MNKSIPLMLATSLVLAGCAVGPNYQRPLMELPEAVEAAPAATLTAPTPSVTGQAWWRVYQDANLDSLIDEALANNTDVRIAAARVAEAQAQLGLARSDQQPTAYLSAERRRSRMSESLSTFQADIPSASTGNRVALNVSYEIDFWGRYRRATEAARAELLAVEANRAVLGLLLANRLAQGYINLIALDAEWAATTEGVARAREAYLLQQKRLAAGVISTFEFGQREAEYQAAQALLPPIEKARAQQERALLTLLGRSPKAVVGDKIARSNTLVAPQALPGGIPSALLLNRPDVREAEQKLIAANARIGVARAAYFPSISLTGNVGGESAALSDLFVGPARIWRFAGELTQPLWGAGRLQAQKDIAEARNEQALQSYRATVVNAFREVADALSAHTKATQTMTALTRQVAALTQTWELAKLRSANGLANQLEVIDIERSLLQAELSRIAAERDLRLTVADFYSALGGRAG